MPDAAKTLIVAPLDAQLSARVNASGVDACARVVLAMAESSQYPDRPGMPFQALPISEEGSVFVCGSYDPARAENAQLLRYANGQGHDLMAWINDHRFDRAIVYGIRPHGCAIVFLLRRCLPEAALEWREMHADERDIGAKRLSRQEAKLRAAYIQTHRALVDVIASNA
ncbi:MAG: hypothetical protein CMM93_00970 [Rickettsiales bacterium]|nr:hypothetical protein [Rickettsiales bacterium]|tara:strand:- start:2180 stop:2686 length:507 start_codon:yes stop_codon:yes gene_type:complete